MRAPHSDYQGTRFAKQTDPAMRIDPSPATADKNVTRGLPPKNPEDNEVGMRKGGKVKKVMPVAKARLKGYASGGAVGQFSDPNRNKSPPSGFSKRMDKHLDPSGDTDPNMNTTAGATARQTRDRDSIAHPPPPRNVEALFNGGKITRVAGKPIGKEDGLIAVQKGEYVIRKAAVQKHGPQKMAAVNKGTAKITVPSKGKR